MNHPAEAQSSDDITCTWFLRVFFGFLLKKTEVILVLSRFSRSQLLPWLPSCWVPTVLDFIFPGCKKNVRLIGSLLEPRPPWWCYEGGHCATALLACWLERCEESSSILFVRELPLAFCVRAGFTGNRSLMKTFLAQHFSHLQAMVTGTIQKPSGASSFVEVWQEAPELENKT